ncbi:unnamed protein product [Rhodiola kirilowii]
MINLMYCIRRIYLSNVPSPLKIFALSRLTTGCPNSSFAHYMGLARHYTSSIFDV